MPDKKRVDDEIIKEDDENVNESNDTNESEDTSSNVFNDVMSRLNMIEENLVKMNESIKQVSDMQNTILTDSSITDDNEDTAQDDYVQPAVDSILNLSLDDIND